MVGATSPYSAQKLGKSKLLLKMNAINLLRFFNQAPSDEYYEVPLPSLKP